MVIMKCWLPLLFVMTIVLSGHAQADKILGVWLSENKDGKIQIYKTGDKYYGKLIWLQPMYEADGITLKKDNKNPAPELRSRSLKDLVIVMDLIYEDGSYDGGKIYDPQSGKTYSCLMKLKEDKLHIRGYIGMSMFGRTSVWTRTQ